MAVSRDKPLVYRLEEIPTVISKEDLLLLFPPKARDRMIVTSLSPSINLNRRTATATISFLPLSEESLPMPSDPDICIDKNFYGFTPLYTPEGHIDVDIIAITGLAGHAFGSWSITTQRMWLRDFLPRDLPQARILLYGYDSRIVNSQSRSILADFSSNFIVNFNAMRGQSHSKDRPVIFIGHSLGCLMIKEVLIDLGSYFDRRGAPTRPTVKSVIFFGAPHRGLEVTAMQSMVQGTPSEDLIRELKMHSPTLERLNDGFRRVYDGVNILTIYEMEPTASLRRDELDTWERNGPPVMMVEKDSAILYWPMETRIGLNQDHSRIAKVDRGQNGCYDAICYFLQKSLKSTDKASVMPIVNARAKDSSDLPISGKGELDMGRELCEAIKNGNSKAARDLVHLVEKGSLVKLRGNPLRLAVQHCPEILSTLLDAGADLSARVDENGSQAIHTAGRYAKSPDTVQLLLRAGADVNSPDIDARTPLYVAAKWNNNPEIFQVLIDAGATVNASNTDGHTPLHAAAGWNKNPEVVQVLIDAGATVSVSNTDGHTPLHLAAAYNNPKVVQVLIDAGATINVSNTDGHTPLHLAAANNNNPEIFQVLIDAGATVNASNTDGYTPLLAAARWNNNPKIVQVLIEAKANVNATDVKGASPLMLSVSNKNPEICRELLAAGAHLNQKDNYGHTALYQAIREGEKVVVSHLLECGADPRAMSRKVVAPKDLRFAKSVPTVTRNEIRELIIKATRPPAGKAQKISPSVW